MYPKPDDRQEPLKSPLKPHIMAKTDNMPPELLRYVLSLQTAISQNMAMDIQVAEIYLETHTKQMLVSFRSWLWGEELQSKEFVYPCNWFEHLKERVFPNWLLRFFPVNYVIHKFEIRAIYPALREKLTLPEEDHVMHIHYQKFLEEDKEK